MVCIKDISLEHQKNYYAPTSSATKTVDREASAKNNKQHSDHHQHGSLLKATKFGKENLLKVTLDVHRLQEVNIFLATDEQNHRHIFQKKMLMLK